MVSNYPPPPNEGAPTDNMLEEELKACLSMTCSLVGTAFVKGMLIQLSVNKINFKSS